MENKEWKIKIHTKDENIDFIPKHANSNKTNYLVLSLLTKEQQLLYMRYNFGNVYKHTFQMPPLKTLNQNKILTISICPAHVNYTSNPRSIPKNQDIVINNKDSANEIMLYLPHIKNSHNNLCNYYENNSFLPTAGKKDCLLSLLQCFPDNPYNDYIVKQNVSYNFSGIDLMLVEFMYKMEKYFVQNIEWTHQPLLDANSYTILIDLEKNKHLVFSNHKSNNIQYKDYKIKPMEWIEVEKPTNIFYSKNIQIVSHNLSPVFNIPTEHHYKQLPISKYHSFCSDFFKKLASVYLISQHLSSTNKPIQSISLCSKSWHIQNIALGYSLHNMLKNFNINTLFVIRNLHFEIITSTTPNLRIEFNFKLQNGIFMVYDTIPYFTKPFIGTNFHWNINSSILKKPCSIDTPLLMKKKCSVLQQLKASAYKLWPSDLNIHKISKTDIALDFEANDSTTSCSYIDSETLISLHTKPSSISKSDKGCIEKFIMYLKSLSGQDKLINAEGAAGDTLFNNKINISSNMYDLPFLSRRIWLTKLNKHSKEIEASFNIFFMKLDCINETIFERLSPCEFGDLTNQCCFHLSWQTSCKVFFKCFGKSLINVFFGATL